MPIELDADPGHPGPEWYRLEISECLRVLDVDGESGLSSAEVTARRSEFGRNEFAEDPPEPAWRAFLEQYRGFMQLMLLGAAIVSFTIGQVSTGVLLIGLTVMNAFLGYRQEAEAEEALESLRQMMSVATRVRRDGALVEVPAEDLVPGDVVQLEAGDLVPADGRLMQAASLEVEESALTGESQPVGKSSSAVDVADMPLGDRFSVAYMNTLVSRGTATMVVTSTGMSTEMGRIAGMLAGVERSRSPLQQQMDDLAKVFGVLAGFALVVMVGIGLARGLEREALLLLAVSVAVGAIPTGLPTLVTTLLSLATQELAKLGAIVKSLTAVETLGSTTAICSDKTGTLTLNQMTARVLAFDGNTYRIEGEGYSTEGAILRTGGERNLDLDPLLIAMILASDATAGAGAIVGDPTEGALVVLAAKGGLATDTTRAAYPRLAEVPFDAAYKFMATFHQWTTSNGRAVIRCFVKGAPDVLLARASEIQWNGRTQPIDTVRDRVTAGIEELGSQGMRALSFAQRDFDPSMFDPGEDLLALVSDLTVTGFVGIVDPPRPEARTAIARAGDAGIRVRMITGDHLATASAIATELDIEGAAIDGVELDSMSDDELAERIGGLGVFGRVVPEHKVRLVNALKAEGQVTAMTGDGVNDAPALKSADIGVAMGITGTEASKQAATMILTDDNFDTIVRAVEQGRIIYDNLMKYIRFQTSSLVAFIATFVAAAVFNIASGAPLTPLQILFVNFAVTAPPAIALGRDRASPGIMQRPPRKPGTKIISQARALRVTLIGLTMAAATLTAFALGPNDFTANTATVAGTMGFVTLSLAHVAAAIANRFELTTSFGPELLSNPRLLRGLGLSIVATVLATELRFLQRWLPTVSLTAAQWGICILAATTVLVVDEGRKIIEQRRTVAPGPAVELEPRPAPEGPEQHRYQLAGYLLLAGIVATLAGVSADFTTPDQAVSQLINGTTNGWIPLLSSLLAIVVFPRFRRGKFPAIIAVSTVAFGALARVISVRTLEDVSRNWGWWVALAGASLLLAATVLATVLRLANRRRDPLRRPRGLKQIGGVIALPIVIIALYAMGQILEIQETVSWPPTPDAITADTAQRTTELFAASNTAPADIKFDYAWSTAATVEPWPEGVEFYPRLFADIGQAKSSIHIIMFGWKPGDVSDDLVEILEAKRAEGVEVRAIVDSVGSDPYTDSVDLYRRLQAAGVEVVVNDSVPVSDKNASQLTLPPSDSGSAEIGRTDHRKLYVIDGTVAWTGGAGIEDHFRDGSFHDVLVRVTGDVVLQAQAVFLTSFASHDAPLPSDLGPYFPQQPLSGTTPIALVQTIPGGFSSAAQQVRQMIDQAEDSLDIMNPYLTDEGMADRIAAAADRGVTVRLILSETSNTAATEQATEYFYPRLLDAGVEIWEYPDAVVHAKLVVADDRAHFGTLNLDAWSLYRSFEIAMVVDDPQIADNFRQRIFDPDVARSLPAVEPSLAQQASNWVYYKLTWFL